MDMRYIARQVAQKVDSVLCLRKLLGTILKLAITIQHGNNTIVRITTPNRIGHLIPEAELFIKEIKLGRISVINPVIIDYHQAPFANKEFKNMLARYFKIIKLPWVPQQVAKHAHVKSKYDRRIEDYIMGLNGTDRVYEIQSQWGDRGPIFSPDDYKDSAGDLLRQIGWNPEQPYVCIHARENGYAPKERNNRNSDIYSYLKAIRYFVDRGLNVIRMGDPTMKRVDFGLGFFDYALSELRNDKNDIVLASQCKLFLGCASGASWMASCFHVPTMQVNMFPLYWSDHGLLNCLGLPRIAENIESGLPMHYRQICESRVLNWTDPDHLMSLGIRLRPNTDEDIYKFSIESLNRVNGAYEDTSQDLLLQKTLSGYIKDGSRCNMNASPCSRYFLRKWAHLIL